MKTVVVTGCCGFIGRYVTKACLNKCWKVYGIDKLTYVSQKPVYCGNPDFHFIQEDICNLKRLPDCDYVINLAAESHVGNSIVSNHEFVHSNVEGVRNLLELIRSKPKNAYGKPVFIHFSTDEVYGDITEEEGAFYERDVLDPSSPYSASKAAADMLVTAWSRTYGIKYNIIRPTNNYGIGQYPEKLIPLSVKLLQAEKKICLHDKGEPVRSWLHVEDTAAAVMCIIKKGKLNEIYNIGGVEQKNKNVVKKVIETYYSIFSKEEVDWTKHVNLNFVRKGQDVRYAVDDKKLRALGWSPKKDFDHELLGIIRDCLYDFRW